MTKTPKNYACKNALEFREHRVDTECIWSCFQITRILFLFARGDLFKFQNTFGKCDGLWKSVRENLGQRQYFMETAAYAVRGLKYTAVSEFLQARGSVRTKNTSFLNFW